MTIPEGFKTTKFTSIDDIDKPMTGKELYPVVGDYPDKKFIQSLIKKCKGMSLYWNCLEKARLISEYFPESVVTIGSMYVWSGNFKSQYGYEHRPPYEFHAWLKYKEYIIDIALPGVIKTGLKLKDEIGPYIVNRKPIIFAGSSIPDFLVYEPKEHFI